MTTPLGTLEVLEQRLRRILDRYLTRLSPLADLRVEGENRLCGVDLLRRRAAKPESAFRYRARAHHEAGTAALGVERSDAGRICMTLPRVPVASSAAPNDASRYAVVVIENGAARYPLLAHLYDLGPTRGYGLVGIERPDSADASLEHVGLDRD